MDDDPPTRGQEPDDTGIDEKDDYDLGERQCFEGFPNVKERRVPKSKVKEDNEDG